MKFDEINPIMMNITVNKTAAQDSAPFSFGKRTVEYYELERIGSSYGTIILEGKSHRLSENDVFLRKPGQTVEGFMPYRFQYLTFRVADDSDVHTFLDALPDKVHLRGNPQVQVMFDEIQSLYLGGRETAALLIKSRILELLALFSEQARSAGCSHPVRAALAFMEENYSRDISVEEIASQAGISARSLFQQFQESLSDTPAACLGRIRLEKSKALLLDTSLPVSEISAHCGFRSASYFDYAFKQQEGISPGAFRKRYILSKK